MEGLPNGPRIDLTVWPPVAARDERKELPGRISFRKRQSLDSNQQVQFDDVDRLAQQRILFWQERAHGQDPLYSMG